MRIHESAYVADGAVILGDVSVGEESSIWFHVTIRADRDKIVIGSRSNIQDNAVVHVDKGFPAYIGDGVTVGHGAVIHGCRIGDNALIGMGAIILNGARVGKNCIVGAGALIPQNMIIPDNSLAIGCPAKIMRQVTKQEVESNQFNADEYVEEGQKYKMNAELEQEG
ncbi:gamma carbonic anhydrase family protein [Lachnospiraceae bacterium]|nr:gamma carbonic anhydrase family protein [Lachnospiraceae bacterium]